MKKYNILWIDDEYEKLSDTMELAEVVHGFQITKCRFAKEGMKIFEQNLEKWSAVILDAKVLMESLDEVADLKGLRYSRDRINELKSKRYVPMFVLTGAPDVISNELFEMMVDKYYTKGDDEEQLFADVKMAADNQIETQILHKHQTVFNQWPESYHELLRILTVLENEDWENNSVLNDIRKVFSDIMDRLYERGFCTVPHDKSNLATCSRMLGERYMESIIPVYIQRSIHTCCDVTNPGSHRSDTDKDVRNGAAPYLVRSLIYEMLNVLYWCKNLTGPEHRELVLKAIEQAKEEYEEKRRPRLA